MYHKTVISKKIPRINNTDWQITTLCGRFKISPKISSNSSKRRKVQIHLKRKVKIEHKKLLNEGHIEKFSKCSDQFFISEIVITVKKNQSIKIAQTTRFIKTNTQYQTMIL